MSVHYDSFCLRLPDPLQELRFPQSGVTARVQGRPASGEKAAPSPQGCGQSAASLWPPHLSGRRSHLHETAGRARGQGSSSPRPGCLPAWKPLLMWGLPPSSHPTRGPHTPQGNHVSSPTSHTWMALFPKATEATRSQKLQKGPEGRRLSGRSLGERGRQPGKPWGSPGVPLTDPQTARPAGPQERTDLSEGWTGSSHGLSCRVLAWLVVRRASGSSERNPPS